MTLQQIIGIIIILGAYITMWFIVFKTKSIVKKINEKNLSKLREIEKELKL